jgi:hypothetical protein
MLHKEGFGKLYSSSDIVWKMKSRMLNWAKNVIRPGKTNACRLLVEVPRKAGAW